MLRRHHLHHLLRAAVLLVAAPSAFARPQPPNWHPEAGLPAMAEVTRIQEGRNALTARYASRIANSSAAFAMVSITATLRQGSAHSAACATTLTLRAGAPGLMNDDAPPLAKVSIRPGHASKGFDLPVALTAIVPASLASGNTRPPLGSAYAPAPAAESGTELVITQHSQHCGPQLVDFTVSAIAAVSPLVATASPRVATTLPPATLPARNAGPAACSRDSDCPRGFSCECGAAGLPGPNGNVVCATPMACYPSGMAPIARP